MLERIEKEKLDSSFEEVKMSLLSTYEKKDLKNHPTHFTMTLGENGFDKIKYYRKKLVT